MELNTIIHGDAIEKLKELPDKCIHTCVTSPPYWNLRDYGVDGQIGLEETPEIFIARLVEVFREVKRVLRDDGTLWVNIGDSYAAREKNRTEKQASAKSNIQGSLAAQSQSLKQKTKIVGELKPKDLVGIPWMLAFALRADGWYLRQDIIWHKPTSMPESVTDRCTKNHEYIFLLSKSKTYYYDHVAIMQQAKNPADDVRRRDASSWDDKTAPTEFVNGLRPRENWKGSTFDKGKTGRVMDEYRNGVRKSGNKERKSGAERGCPENTGSNVSSNVPWEGTMANKRSVWTVTPRAFTEAHFATYPPELIVDCIKAGTSEWGCCNHCGAPYQRGYKKTLEPTNKASFNSNIDKRDIAADKQDAGSNRMKDGHKPGHINEYKTMGWVPTCECFDIKHVPCIVLDPFGGAATTGLVARKLGRNFILIEINEKYINEISMPRLKRELGLFY